MALYLISQVLLADVSFAARFALSTEISFAVVAVEHIFWLALLTGVLGAHLAYDLLGEL